MVQIQATLVPGEMELRLDAIIQETREEENSFLWKTGKLQPMEAAILQDFKMTARNGP